MESVPWPSAAKTIISVGVDARAACTRRRRDPHPMTASSGEDAPSPDASLALAFSEDDGSLLARLGQGASDGARAWLLNAMAHRLSLVRGFDRLLAWPSLQDVTRYEHQERTALRVLRELRGRAILADEVGLGKTIEAGLILKELLVRGLAKKVLILTPASLATQGREEMERKFGIDFEIGDELEDWARHDRVISSIDTAKRDVHKEEIQKLSYDVVVRKLLNL